MVRTFCSGIYLQLMIVMCFKKLLIFDDEPLFPDGKDFGDVSRKKINIMPRHDVIYVDKLTYCIQDTSLSIRWWSFMWHDSQSCYKVLSIRQYAFTITASISLGKNSFPPSAPLSPFFGSTFILCVFAYQRGVPFSPHLC